MTDDRKLARNIIVGTAAAVGTVLIVSKLVGRRHHCHNHGHGHRHHRRCRCSFCDNCDYDCDCTHGGGLGFWDFLFLSWLIN